MIYVRKGLLETRTLPPNVRMMLGTSLQALKQRPRYKNFHGAVACSIF